MAPEVITAKWVKRRKVHYTPYDGYKADIYSFGVMLYEIVSLGELPYEGKSAAEYIQKVLDEAVDASQMPIDTPKWLADMYKRCVRSDAEAWPTAQELLEEVERRIT